MKTQRLIILLTLLMLVVAISACWLLWSLSSRAQSQHTKAQLSQLLTYQQRSLNQWLERWQQFNQTLLESPEVRAYQLGVYHHSITSYPDIKIRLIKKLHALLRRHPSLQSIRFIDSQGSQQLQVSLMPNDTDEYKRPQHLQHIKLNDRVAKKFQTVISFNPKDQTLQWHLPLYQQHQFLGWLVVNLKAAFVLEQFNLQKALGLASKAAIINQNNRPLIGAPIRLAQGFWKKITAQAQTQTRLIETRHHLIAIAPLAAIHAHLLILKPAKTTPRRLFMLCLAASLLLLLIALLLLICLQRQGRHYD